MTIEFEGYGTIDVYTSSEMQAAQCQHGPNCTASDAEHQQLFLNPRCHMGGGVEAMYDKRVNAVLLVCYVCKAPIGALLLKADA